MQLNQYSRFNNPNARASLLWLRDPDAKSSGPPAMAECFFKFGTFTLEALAFLGLWLVLGAAHAKVLSWLSKWTPRIPSPDSFYA